MFRKPESIERLCSSIMLGNKHMGSHLMAYRRGTGNVPYYLPATGITGDDVRYRDVGFGVTHGSPVELAMYLGMINCDLAIVVTPRLEYKTGAADRLCRTLGAEPFIVEDLDGNQEGTLAGTYTVGKMESKSKWHVPLPADVEAKLAALYEFSAITETSRNLTYHDLVNQRPGAMTGQETAFIASLVTGQAASMEALEDGPYRDKTQKDIVSFANPETVFLMKYLSYDFDAPETEGRLRAVKDEVETYKIAMEILGRLLEPERAMSDKSLMELSMVSRSRTGLSQMSDESYAAMVRCLANITKDMDMPGMIEAYRSGVPVDDIIA